jgi:hypothetical protein
VRPRKLWLPSWRNERVSAADNRARDSIEIATSGALSDHAARQALGHLGLHHVAGLRELHRQVASVAPAADVPLRRTDPCDRLAALPIVTGAMVAEVIEKRNDCLINGSPPGARSFAETLIT